jgi:hypothetical protein
VIVYGLWFGGSSYSTPDHDDPEAFASLAAARTAFLDRYRYGYWQRSRFAYVHRLHDVLLTPCVDATCFMLLYACPDQLTDPRWRLCLGPREGIRTERL